MVVMNSGTRPSFYWPALCPRYEPSHFLKPVQIFSLSSSFPAYFLPFRLLSPLLTVPGVLNEGWRRGSQFPTIPNLTAPALMEFVTLRGDTLTALNVSGQRVFANLSTTLAEHLTRKLPYS